MEGHLGMSIYLPNYLQTKKYPAADDRRLIQSIVEREGVRLAGDLAVGPRVAGGANMSVDVQAGAAFIDSDNGTGYYHVRSDALENRAINANSSGNPRVDRVVLRVYDSAAGDNAATEGAVLEVLAGTPTAGATLTNQTGAVAVPARAIHLADVLVPNAATAITTTEIADRRLTAIAPPVLPSKLMARRFRSTAQSIANNTFTAVVFDTTHYSNHADFIGAATAVIYVPEDGIYTGKGQVQFAANATGIRAAYVGHFDSAGNSLGIQGYASISATSAGNTIIQADLLPTEMRKGEYIRLYVYQNSGGALNIEAVSPYAPVLTFEKVRDRINA